ncbi:tyrosine-type recombinase/integrase [Maritimibacter sp. UBA3975]|uniref:tyrosine-type recombinase/integrase n=2 Tax=Maritimibacter TaxID=404235 RepID=UPI000C0A386F|nr:site-specific integrase [Maritimibacter sp. UBA3975]MAM60359.1 integrase [Maritimibacter sp.]
MGTYQKQVMEGKSSARTSRSQARTIMEVVDPMTNLHELTQAQMLRAVSALLEERSAATVNRCLDNFKRAINHMGETYDAKLPAKINWTRLKKKEPEERVRELTRAEENALFEHLRNDLHPLVHFALLTGARQGTICGLLWSDIDFDEGRMIFRIKGGGTQRFPLTEETRELLQSIPQARTPATRRYVFTFLGEDGQPHPINPSGGHIWMKWRDAVRDAGIEDFRFHDLRHTFATRMLRQTGNLKLVSRLLGHKSLETTMRYAHVLDDDLEQALSAYAVRPATLSATDSGKVLKIKSGD